jgi:hypothetical protein
VFFGSAILLSHARPDIVAIGQPVHGATLLTTTNGGKTGTVTYVPSAGYTSADFFSYTVQDKLGAQVSGTINITINGSGTTSATTITSVTTSGSTVTIQFSGLPSLTYGIQYSTNLTDWFNVAPTTTSAVGQGQYVDTVRGPTVCYRLIYPGP